MKLQRITVVAGPCPVAYQMQDGKITIWLGDQVENAPTTAYRTKIAEGATSFVVVDSAAMSADERARAVNPQKETTHDEK